ncbi:hypothetical protein [Bernardetia litoralis]|uniref:hypothetical protein n=1 Tax=Bernardetia litoralis TaxID=999 RepID=UPI0012FDA9AF|nr:hypothetical protein [Bernardetia litoralis]
MSLKASLRIKKHFLFPLQKRKNNYIRFYSAISDFITDPLPLSPPTTSEQTKTQNYAIISYYGTWRSLFSYASVLNWEYLLKMDKYKNGWCCTKYDRLFCCCCRFGKIPTTAFWVVFSLLI